jgi:hypothetical protein
LSTPLLRLQDDTHAMMAPSLAAHSLKIPSGAPKSDHKNTSALDRNGLNDRRSRACGVDDTGKPETGAGQQLTELGPGPLFAA